MTLDQILISKNKMQVLGFFGINNPKRNRAGYSKKKKIDKLRPPTLKTLDLNQKNKHFFNRLTINE
jgi:hypothetical protein